MSAMVDSGLVESGEARCPRCMAVAEYTFRETDDGILRYEVTCPTGGHVYSETSTSPENHAA